jgi:hypothetical protein
MGNLASVERGRHALKSGMDVKAYAASVGRPNTNVQHEVMAARVAELVSKSHVGFDLSDHFRTMVEIHGAPSWLWAALVEAIPDVRYELSDYFSQLVASPRS